MSCIIHTSSTLLVRTVCVVSASVCVWSRFRAELERLKAEQDRAWQERLEQEDELFERYEQQKVCDVTLEMCLVTSLFLC